MKKPNKTKHCGKILVILLLLSSILVTKSAASAKENKIWLDTYEEMCSEMEQEAKDIVQKEISTKEKKDVAKEDLGMQLASCDMENAIPLWDMPYDFRMIADYKKYDGDFSKLIIWKNKWYIPAQTMAGTYASIFLQKEDTKYEVYGIFFGEDCVYAADDMQSIKSMIRQNFGDDIADVKTIYLPFYNMNLIYVQDADNKEDVMPYEATFTTVLETIGGEEGKVYELSDYIKEIDNHFEEYTEEELRAIAEQGLFGGNPELKLKTPLDRWKYLILFSVIIVCILLIICIFVIRKKGMENRKDTGEH